MLKSISTIIFDRFFLRRNDRAVYETPADFKDLADDSEKNIKFLYKNFLLI
jgi:hypothetical protein